MLSIRSCSPDECADVLDIWKRSGTRPTATDELAELERVARDHGDLFLVAEVEGSIVGSVIAGWDGWRGHIYRIAVAPDHQRQGVATALIQEAVRRLKERGARRLSILVVAEDSHSIGFWDALTGLGIERDPWPKVRYISDL